MDLPFKVTQVFWMTVKVWDSYDLIIHQGGTSSSKTYSIMQWLILKAAEKKRTITVIGQDLPNLKVGALRDAEEIFSSSPALNDWLEGGTYNSGFNKSNSIYTFKNGSVIEFKSYDSSQDAKSGKRDIAFFNEVNGITKEIFEEIYDRTKEKTICDFNPTAKFWIHDLLDDEKTIRIISNFTHNDFINEKTKRKILKYKQTNKYRWQVYGLGLTGQVEGMIYTNVAFINEIDYPGDGNLKRFGYGIDYGYSNDPFTLICAGLYQGKIYCKGLIYQTGLKLTDIVTRLNKLEVSKYDVISMDDSQAKEQADLLRYEYGYNVKTANRKSGSILSGIALLQDYQIYIVDDGVKNWQKEYENYRWTKKSGTFTSKPVDKYNHYWDALRYWALENLIEAESTEYEENIFII